MHIEKIHVDSSYTLLGPKLTVTAGKNSGHHYGQHKRNLHTEYKHRKRNIFLENMALILNTSASKPFWVCL